MEIVYVDVLLITNFIADYFILLLTARLSCVSVKRWRVFVSAILAALTSLLIFAPEMSAVLETCVKLALSLVIVLACFGFVNFKRYIKAALIFFAANALVAGGALLVFALFAPRGLVVRNGAVFYNISPVTLIITTAFVYAVSLVISKISARRNSRGREYEVTVFFENKKAQVRGIVDSGNMLKDSLSGSPVIVCDYQKIKNILNPELEKILSKQNYQMGFYSEITDSKYKNRFRLIPFESLGSSGIMTALVLDKIEVSSGRESQTLDSVIMAVTHRKIADGEYDVLLSPELVTV